MGAFWAIDGIGNPAAPVAAAAVPAMNVRRLSRKTIFSSLGRGHPRRRLACRRRRRRSTSGLALFLGFAPLLPLRRLQYDPALITSGYLADYRMFGFLLRGSGPALMALALAISPAAPQSADPAQDAIRTALLRWTADFNARKSAAICDLFAPDLRYDYRGQPERGCREICDLLHRSLSDP